MKYVKRDLFRSKTSEFMCFFLKERDDRPRTVLNQLYDYKGGIVPNAAEAEKPAANQQV